MLILPLGSYAQDKMDELHGRDKVKIAAGDLLDGYYMIALRFCRYISNSNAGLRCEVVPTSGSAENLMLLQEGKVDFAFAMSNVALEAYEGQGAFSGSKFDDLCQLLNLHEVYFTVMSKDKDNIVTFKDLESKKISNGPPLSDSTHTYNQISGLYDFRSKPVDVEMLYEDYVTRYCNSEVDALVIMTGHPNALVNLITHKCESDFVSIDQKKLDIFLKDNRSFYKKILKKGDYPGITEDQVTVATRAVFVTNQKAHRTITRNFLDYISIRFEQLKLADEVLSDINIGDFTQGFILPSFANNLLNK